VKSNIFDGLSADEIREVTLHCRRGERFGLGILFILFFKDACPFLILKYLPYSGTMRTLEDFEESCGVNFSDMEIQPRNWEQFVSQCGVCKSASFRSCSFVQDIKAPEYNPSEETGVSGGGSDGGGVLTALLNELQGSGMYFHVFTWSM
jgi:hypothetical protein